MFAWLFKKKREEKEKKLMFANIVNSHVKLVLQCFVMLVTQILETLAHDVGKQILWKKS